MLLYFCHCRWCRVGGAGRCCDIYLLRGDFLYFWSYPEEAEQSKVGPACDVQYDGVTTVTAATRTCAYDCSVLCVLCVCVCVYVVCVLFVCVCVLYGMNVCGERGGVWKE